MLKNLLSDLGAGIPIGRQPHVSINGRQFSAVFSGERRPIAEWDAQRAAQYMDFIVIGAGASVFKIMYAGGYDPENPEAPVCWSANGQGPSNQVRQPQAALCSACPWDRWGSAVSPNGTPIKRCTDKKRLVVVSLVMGTQTPLQFDLPPASFKAWQALLRILNDAGVKDVENVVIRAYFEPNENGVLSYHLAAYVDQKYGVDALQLIRNVAAGKEVLELSGRNDRPIDPATWTPALASGPSLAIEAPVNQAYPVSGEPGVQPGLAPVALPAQTFAPPANQLPATYQGQQAFQPAFAPQGQPQAFAPQGQPAFQPQAFAPQGQPAFQPQAFAPQGQQAFAPQGQQAFTAQSQATPAAQSSPVAQNAGEEGVKQKRYRRTKAEMEAARAEAGPQPGRQLNETAALAGHGMASATTADDQLRKQIAEALSIDIPG